MKISSKTQILMEPAASVSLEAVGTIYSTPQEWAVRLGRIALWNEKEAEWKYKISLNQETTAGVITVKLLVNGATISEKTVTVTSGMLYYGRQRVDLSGIEGQSEIKAVVEVDTAANAATKATFDSVLEIESPLILAGC